MIGAVRSASRNAFKAVQGFVCEQAHCIRGLKDVQTLSSVLIGRATICNNLRNQVRTFQGTGSTPMNGLDIKTQSRTLNSRLLINHLSRASGAPRVNLRSALLQHARSYYTDRRGYTHFDRGGLSVFQSPKGRRQVTRLILIGGGIMYIIYITNQQEVPYTRRKHLILCSVAAEKAMGAVGFAQVKASAAAQGKLLPPTHKAVRAVESVGRRLAEVAGNGKGGGYQGQLQNMEWEFIVVDDNVPNAFVLPGGKVCMYTGLLRLLSNDDELAAVMAHELAHVVARHSAERMTQSSVFSLLQMVMYLTLGAALPVGVVELAFFLPYSRQNETEADLIGMHIAAQACYDPSAGARVFAKLDKVERAHGIGAIPEWLRTHPVNEQRIARIQQEVPKAMITRDTYCVQRYEDFASFR